MVWLRFTPKSRNAKTATQLGRLLAGIVPLPSYMALTKNEERDKKVFLVDGGDPGFNPARNKAIIEDTIKKYELMRERKRRDYNDKLGERVDAVATYLKSMAADSNKPVEKYFSKRELAHLRGKKIIQVLQGQARILGSIN